MHLYTPENSLFDGPVTNLLSVQCSLVEILSRGHAKGAKSLNDLKFGTVVGRFASGTLASIAVKGLRQAISECLECQFCD